MSSSSEGLLKVLELASWLRHPLVCGCCVIDFVIPLGNMGNTSVFVAWPSLGSMVHSMELAHFCGNISGNVDARSCRVFVKGGGSKFVFRDENPGASPRAFDAKAGACSLFNKNMEFYRVVSSYVKLVGMLVSTLYKLACSCVIDINRTIVMILL